MQIAKSLFIVTTKVVSFMVIAIFISAVLYLIFKGVSTFELNLIKNELYSAILGTLFLLFLSISFAFPLGLATGIYIHSYAKGRIKRVLDLCFEILATIPSIIIGLFGFSLLLFLHSFFGEIKSSLALASISLGFLILPYIIKATQIGFEEVDKKNISIAYSLGAIKEDVILKILLPLAKIDILKGLFLAIARASEDTAVIMLTGVVASYGVGDSIFSPFEAIPFYIYYTSDNYMNSSELDTIFVAVVILMMISSGFMWLVSAIKGLKNG